MTSLLHTLRRVLTLRLALLFVVAIAASVGFAMLAAEIAEGELDAVDKAAELAVHKLDSAPADVVMKAATMIGSYAVVAPLVVLVCAYAFWRGYRRAAIVLAIDAGVVIVANAALKLVYARARPTLFDKVPLPHTYSFPSGHSMAAVGVLCVVLGVIAGMAPRAKPAMIILGIFLPLLIGLSRIYLGVHWPLDVIGGFIAGTPPLIVSLYLIRRPERRRGPTAAASSIRNNQVSGEAA